MRCFDGHCDTLARCMTTGEGLRQNGGHVDLARCAALGQHAQIFAVFADSSKTSAPLYTVAQRQHALLERECARNADLVRRCRTAWDVRAAWAAGKTAALLGIEGAELLDCDPRRLDDAAAWECVYVTLTWNHANALAGSHCDAQAQGLTAQGRDFVRALYAHQMLPDVSHLSEAAAWDVVRLGLGPVIASHANSRAVCAHTRNLSDEELASGDFSESLKWWDECIAAHKAAGMKYLVTPSMPFLKSLKELQVYCDYFNEIGKRCRENGIKYCYHNHAFEFQKIEDQVMLEYMIRHTDPENVLFEMDVYWVVIGQNSPVDLFHKYPGRFKMLHIKDLREIGQSGMVGFDAIFRNADVAGVEQIVVEVEQYSYDVEKSVRMSLDYLMEAPFVKASYSK